MTIADLRKEVQQLKDEAQQKAIATAGTIADVVQRPQQSRRSQQPAVLRS